MKKHVVLPLLMGIVFTIPAPAAPPEKGGPENVSLPPEDIGEQGNWRKKKDWVKQAGEKNESIQKILADVQGFRPTFDEKAKEVSSLIDAFYQKTGFNKGETTAFFEEVEKDIKSAKARALELFTLSLTQADEKSKTEAQKIKAQYADTASIEESFKTYKNNLDQLKLDMQTITDLDKSAQERFNQANERMGEIQSEADRAQELSKRIWRVIADIIARDIFYELSSINEKAKSLQTYLKIDLIKDIESVITTIKDQIKKTSDGMENLEKQGFVVMNRAKQIEAESKKAAELLEKKAEEKPARKRPSLSWWEKIKSLFF